MNHVNSELEANPGIIELIGSNPFDLMRNNHSNHAIFMTTVFKIASYELLARIGLLWARNNISVAEKHVATVSVRPVLKRK